MTPMPPPDLMQQFDLSMSELVGETGIARVWKVTRRDEVLALKVYHDRDMRNEQTGFDYIRALGGRSAVRITDQTDGAVLMEWLEGPSLGDLTRAGRDEEAAATLVKVAADLHSHPVSVADLPALSDWFESLFRLKAGRGCSDSLGRDISAAQALARDLLADPRNVRPLHGDLHHDNIMQGARGWCAFDAKGVLGEKAYELANAFRNPKGADALIRDPARIDRCARLWADRFGVDHDRLLQWAAVKVALSIAWRASAEVEDDAEADLLALMLAKARPA